MWNYKKQRAGGATGRLCPTGLLCSRPWRHHGSPSDETAAWHRPPLPCCWPPFPANNCRSLVPFLRPPLNWASLAISAPPFEPSPQKFARTWPAVTAVGHPGLAFLVRWVSGKGGRSPENFVDGTYNWGRGGGGGWIDARIKLCWEQWAEEFQSSFA